MRKGKSLGKGRGQLGAQAMLIMPAQKKKHQIILYIHEKQHPPYTRVYLLIASPSMELAASSIVFMALSFAGLFCLWQESATRTTQSII